MMTACDLSDQTKSFENSKAIAVSTSLPLEVFIDITSFYGHNLGSTEVVMCTVMQWFAVSEGG